MSRNFPRFTRLAATLAVALLTIGAIGAIGATPAFAAEPALQKVEAKKVCMVNDQLFGKDQIPVEVEGRTYYGCCAMCKERLAKDEAARTSVDPLSGKKVDKAAAVIGARPDGSVLYFESEKTFAEYLAKSPQGDKK
jgi:YHS domain-containing protein